MRIQEPKNDLKIPLTQIIVEGKIVEKLPPRHVIARWGGTAKLINVETGEKLEVPHVIDCDDQDMITSLFEQVEEAYIIPRDVATEYLIDEFGRKDTRYQTILSENLDTMYNIVELFLTLLTIILAVQGLIYIFDTLFPNQLALVDARIKIAALIAVTATTIFAVFRYANKKTHHIHRMALWDYRARTARQYLRLAKLVGEKTKPEKLFEIKQPQLVFLVWKKHTPYITEHVFTPCNKEQQKRI